MGFQTRTPTSNDLPKIKGSNLWIEETPLVDATCLLINGFAKRCTICKRPIRIKYLDKDQHCPDCRES